MMIKHSKESSSEKETKATSYYSPILMAILLASTPPNTLLEETGEVSLIEKTIHT
jgi:hypothetical protein